MGKLHIIDEVCPLDFSDDLRYYDDNESEWGGQWWLDDNCDGNDQDTDVEGLEYNLCASQFNLSLGKITCLGKNMVVIFLCLGIEAFE